MSTLFHKTIPLDFVETQQHLQNICFKILSLIELQCYFYETGFFLSSAFNFNQQKL